MIQQVSTAPVVSATDPNLEPLQTLIKRLTGKRPSHQTLWRWLHKPGKSGVRLPSVLILGRWHSTPEAIEWFFAARTAAHNSTCGPREIADVSAEELASVGL